MAITGKNAAISEALDYRLSTLVLSPTRRVAWRGTTFTPVASEIYLRPSFLPGQTNFGAVGSNAPRRHRGIYQVDVVGPVNVTPVTQDEIADLVIEHFVSQVIARNNVRVRIGTFDGGPAVPSRAPELMEDGWRQVPISIPWWCDTF